MKKILFAFVLFALISCQIREPEIAEWRGKDRTGIYPDTGLLKEWPEEGPAEILVIENIGNGFGSPVFIEDQFFVTGEIDSMARLFCYNLKGEKIWQSTPGKEWMKSYSGGRDAPTVVGDLIYMGTGLGDLYCISRADGKTVWSRKLKKDFKGVLPYHGFTNAPIVVGEKVYWTPGGKEHNIVALNRHTGELIWTNPAFGEPQGYNSPKLISLAERDIIVTFSAYHLLGFDAETGELLWEHEQDNLAPDQRKPGYGDTHSNTVVYENGMIYYVAGDGNCGVKLELAKDGSSIKEVWRNRDFDGYMGGIVKLGDHLYGGCTAKPELRSVNTKTGETSDSLRLGPGTIIAADSMIYYYSQKGEMNLISYIDGKMNKVSSFKINKGSKQHFSHPVIYKGILYLRRGNTLMGFDIRKQQI
ncbi:MAG: PQQ-binding-like beta-propeller repeat protein [Bacteroidota bacterium]